MNRRTMKKLKAKKLEDKFRLHDLRKDPTDLPENGEKVLIYKIENAYDKSKYVLYGTVQYFNGFNCSESSSEYIMNDITLWRRLETVEELG